VGWRSFFSPQRIRLVLISLAHAGLLTLLTLWWMSVGTWEFGDEVVIERITQSRFLLFGNEDPLVAETKKKLLLINCSYDKILVPYQDDFGEGTRPITDRKKLAELLNIINRAPSKPDYTLWDIFLDHPSPYDSALIAELQVLDRVILSSYLTDSSTLYQPYPGLTYALAQYATMSDTFLKYRLLQSNEASYVPAQLYLQQHGHTWRTWAGFVFGQGWWLNSFIVDLPIRRVHMDNNEITVWNVGEALENFTPEEIQETVAGRLVVFGDFYENDVHETFLGQQPGPLILINTYLGLVKEGARITLLLFSCIFLLYFVATQYVFHLREYREKLFSQKIYRVRIARFLFKYLTYIVIFAIYTVLVYLVTEQHVQLLLFALYFNVFDFLMSKYGDEVKAWLGISLPPPPPGNPETETVAVHPAGIDTIGSIE
jgi:hypothetical protein